MTVNEMFERKYREFMLKVNAVTWRNIEAAAENEERHPAEIIYKNYLSISEFDIKENGGYNSEFYAEIKKMHENKLLASNCHRQEHGHVDYYWLTKKGVALFKKQGIFH